VELIGCGPKRNDLQMIHHSCEKLQNRNPKEKKSNGSEPSGFHSDLKNKEKKGI